MRMLRTLSKDALLRVRLAVRWKPFYILYDNINFSRRKHDQRVDNSDEFLSCTNATIVVGEKLDEAKEVSSTYSELKLEDLQIKKESNDHFKKAAAFHLASVLKMGIEEFSHCSVSEPVIDKLETKKTERHLLSTLKNNQSTTEGNKEVLEAIIKLLNLDKEKFEKAIKIIIAGDQLTVARVRALKALLTDESSKFNRFEWAEPVIQLFHLQMIYAKGILRNFRGLGEPGSLDQIGIMLNRKRINDDNGDFHAIDEFLRHTFDAMVLRVWELLFNTKDLRKYAQTHSETIDSEVDSKVEEFVNKYLDVNTAT
ncbi:hypothetical protein BGZ76_006233, partial [Entomortierella beljakovae]